MKFQLLATGLWPVCLCSQILTDYEEMGWLSRRRDSVRSCGCDWTQRIRDCGREEKLASLKQFTMCDCSHRIVQYAQLQWATTSARAQLCGPAAIRARSLPSRIEHWRGSARIVSSVSAKERFDLANGSILLYLPKSSGGARIDTAVATAAGTSFTAMAEYHPKSWIKFIILEGHGSISLKHHPGEARSLHAGQMIIVRAGATKLPEPQDIDLSELIKTSLLVTKFPPLPNLNLILREARESKEFATE